MRLLWIGFLAALLLLVIARYVLWPKPDIATGKIRFPYVTAIILTSALIVSGWFEWSWRSDQAELTQAVRELTGREDATVECQRAGAAMFFAGAESGRVEWEVGDERGTGSTAWLTWETCSDLRSWLHSDRRVAHPDQIVALHVAAHEAMHVAGERNEARTECLAMAYFPRLVQLLNGNPSDVERMQNYYRGVVYPQLKSNYQMDCSEVVADLNDSSVPG